MEEGKKKVAGRVGRCFYSCQRWWHTVLRFLFGSFPVRQSRKRQIIGSGVYLFLLAGNITVYFTLSIRKDLSGYFTRKGVGYPPHVNDMHEVLWWIHRMAAVFWTIMIYVHLWSVWMWGYIPVSNLHQWVGMGILCSDLVNSLSGVIALAIQPFDNIYTTCFVSVNASYNILLILAFFLSRLNVFGWKKYHPMLAFGFLVSPYGFTMQFVLFAFMLSWKGDVETKWNDSLLTTITVGSFVCFLLWTIYQHTRLAVAVKVPTFLEEKKKEKQLTTTEKIEELEGCTEKY